MNGIELIVYVAVLFMVCLTIYAYLEGWFSKKPNVTKYRIILYVTEHNIELYKIEKSLNNGNWKWYDICSTLQKAENIIYRLQNPYEGKVTVIKEYEV